jgi:tetratricopeptide (TPR) repeat protein
LATQHIPIESAARHAARKTNFLHFRKDPSMFRLARLHFSRMAVVAMAAGVAALLAAGCQRHSVDDLLQSGDAAMQATKLTDAEKAYQEAVKLAPKDPRVHIALGNLYVFEHKPGEAQLEFMKVIELDPQNPAAHVALGNLYLDQQQFSLAEEQYRAAVALAPARANYLLQLADALRKQGKLPQAEAEIRTAIGLEPQNAQAHLALATLLQSESGREAEAQAEMDRVRALDPKLAAQPAPSPAAAASPGTSAPEAAATPAAPPSAVKIKAVNKVFLLTKNSPVYQNPDTASAQVGKVRRKRYVHVIGITGNFLQIKLRNGTIGFIPISAAE